MAALVVFFVLVLVGPTLLQATGAFVYSNKWVVIKHLFIMLVLITNGAECLACKGTTVEVVCTTTTGTGFLLWQNSSGEGFGFDDTDTVGDSGTLGSTRMTLNSIDDVSNAMVYTSTAMLTNMMENTTIQCSDGGVLRIITVKQHTFEHCFMLFSRFD